jgi:hypothetical protein
MSFLQWSLKREQGLKASLSHYWAQGVVAVSWWLQGGESGKSFLFEEFIKFFLILQKMYAYFKGRFIHMFTGIHPDWLGSDCELVFSSVYIFWVKKEVVAVTVKGVKEKVLAIDGQSGEEQTGALWRKIDYGRGCQTRKRYAGVLILQPYLHNQGVLNSMGSEKEGSHNPSLTQLLH